MSIIYLDCYVYAYWKNSIEKEDKRLYVCIKGILVGQIGMFAMGSSVKFSTRFFILRHLPGMGCQTGSKTSKHGIAPLAKQATIAQEFQQLQVAWQLFLWNSPKKPLVSSQFFLWLVRGSTTSLFAHLFGNHRPSFKIDNQRLVLVVFDSLFPIL